MSDPLEGLAERMEPDVPQARGWIEALVTNCPGCETKSRRIAELEAAGRAYCAQTDPVLQQLEPLHDRIRELEAEVKRLQTKVRNT